MAEVLSFSEYTHTNETPKTEWNCFIQGMWVRAVITDPTTLGAVKAHEKSKHYKGAADGECNTFHGDFLSFWK